MKRKTLPKARHFSEVENRLRVGGSAAKEFPTPHFSRPRTLRAGGLYKVVGAALGAARSAAGRGTGRAQPRRGRSAAARRGLGTPGARPTRGGRPGTHSPAEVSSWPPVRSQGFSRPPISFWKTGSLLKSDHRNRRIPPSLLVLLLLSGLVPKGLSLLHKWGSFRPKFSWSQPEPLLPCKKPLTRLLNHSYLAQITQYIIHSAFKALGSPH